MVLRLDEVTRRADEVCAKAMKDNGPAAHYAEDELMADVLRAIANRECEEPALCAAQAVRSLKLDFDRWYE